MAGSASAHEDFRGCSQVCIDVNENRGPHRAVIATGNGFRCEAITELSDRRNPDAEELRDVSRDGEVACLEVGDGEAIVGICSDARGFVPNPNRCAQNHVPDRDMAAFAAAFDCGSCSL